MKKITAIPKKIMSFFQRHFFLTLLLLFGIYSFGASDSPMPRPMYSKSVGGYNMAYDQGIEMAEESVAQSAPRSRKVASSPIAYADNFAPDATEQKIVKNASLQIEVADTEMTKVLVEEKVKEMKGFVTNLNSWENRPGVLSYNFTLRVPAQDLDIALVAFTSFGAKKSESISSRDITAQYRDNEARIENLKARRDRLRTMMDRETENLSDILQIDQELSRVQEEIERLERSQRQNDNDVSYSTVQLRIEPEPQIGDIQNPQWSAEKSWKKSVNELLESLQKIGEKAIKIIVFAPIWLPIVLVLWFIKRKFFK